MNSDRLPNGRLPPGTRFGFLSSSLLVMPIQARNTFEQGALLIGDNSPRPALTPLHINPETF